MSEPEPQPQAQPPPHPPAPPRQKIALAEEDDGRRRPACRCCGRCVEPRRLALVAGALLCPECAKREQPDRTPRPLPTANASATEVQCPQCRAEFEIAPEHYNQVARCDACKTVFLILAPRGAVEPQ